MKLTIEVDEEQVKALRHYIAQIETDRHNSKIQIIFSSIAFMGCLLLRACLAFICRYKSYPCKEMDMIPT